MSSVDVIHGWYPRMTLPSMDDISPSMDEISTSMDGIFSCQVFGKKCMHHVSNEFVSNCLLALYSTFIDLTRKSVSIWKQIHLKYDASNFYQKPDS